MAVFAQKDKTVYADTYFPERNGIKPVVKNGRNFDNDTLFYMSKVKVARYIADKIESFTFNKPYFVIEICSGIGGNTLEFLSRKNCATVVAFERDKRRSLYLKRNIIAYKFDDKAVVIDDAITGDEDFSSFKDAVFYFDPPWLPEDYKSADADYKSHYIRKGIKIGKLTLENWLEKLKDTAYLVAFRVGPADYDLGEMSGWTYQVENLGRDESRKAQAEDGKLYFCFNNKHIKGADEKKFGGYVKSIPIFKTKLLAPSTELPETYTNYRQTCAKDPIAMAKDANCPFLRYKFEDPEPESVEPVKKALTAQELVAQAEAPVKKGPKFGKVPITEQVWKFKDIPVPSKGLDKDSPEWNAEFQNYLSVVLGKFIPDKDIVNKLITGDNMPVWIRAFTDETLNTDPAENYERLETLGDSVLKFAFKDYLFTVLGDMANQHNITQYSITYMSGTAGVPYQIELGKSFKLLEWLRHSDLYKPREKVNEDLTETFVAALYLTGNTISSKTLLGMRLVQRFVQFCGEKIVFPDTLGDDQTNVSQRFASFLGGTTKRINEYQSGATNNIMITLTINDDTLNAMQEVGISIANKLIGIGKGPNKTQAELSAYGKARAYLDSIGFTDEFVKKVKADKFSDQLKTKNLKLHNLWKTIATNMEMNIDTDFEFEQKQLEEKGMFLVALYDIRRAKPVKLSEATGRGIFEARVNAIKAFVDNN
jgi:dsRNA-specific ribonuclease/16S rRNA G966 N2-methylase RsmD